MNIDTMVSQGGLADISQRPNDRNREKLLTDLKTIVSDAESLLRQTSDLSLEAYALAREGIEVKLAETRQKLVRLSAAVNEKTRRMAASSSAYVCANPGKSVSLAVASGLVFGLAVGKFRQ